jgi:antibiotic biosynthesis monooxygenase (ABM) superfamily enzyme
MRWVGDRQPTSPTPPRYKSAVALTLGLYPLLVVSNLWVEPHLDFLPLLVRLLATTAMNVTVMTYIVMPLMTRLLPSWLSPGAPSENQQGAIDWRREHQGVDRHDSKKGAKP